MWSDLSIEACHCVILKLGKRCAGHSAYFCYAFVDECNHFCAAHWSCTPLCFAKEIELFCMMCCFVRPEMFENEIIISFIDVDESKFVYFCVALDFQSLRLSIFSISLEVFLNRLRYWWRCCKLWSFQCWSLRDLYLFRRQKWRDLYNVRDGVRMEI